MGQVAESAPLSATGLRISVVAARYNADLVEKTVEDLTIYDNDIEGENDATWAGRIETLKPKAEAIRTELKRKADEAESVIRAQQEKQKSQQAGKLNFRMHGIAPTDVALAEFLAKLTAKPFFKQVELTYAHERIDSGHVMREFEDMASRSYYPLSNDDSIAWAVRLRNKNIAPSAEELKLLKAFGSDAAPRIENGYFPALALVGGAPAGAVLQKLLESNEAKIRAAAAETAGRG